MKEFIREQLRSKLMLEELQFNDGKFNKQGANTIYYNGEPIVDFGVGGFGNINVSGQEVPNALYLQGGYNAAVQGQGYGSMGLKFIFNKLPKIENVIIQCYDTACPFWSKMGGKVVNSKDISGSGKLLHTMVINRSAVN